MKMVDKDNMWEKLASYFSDNSTDEERKAIEEWFGNASETERQQYYEAEKIWGFTSGAQEEFHPDTEKAWQRVMLKARMRERRRVNIPWMKVAAAVFLLFVASFLVINYVNKPEFVQVAAVDNVEHVTLPDGSEIWLNKNTTISYSKDFNVDSREVFLKGEAFFEVKKAEGKRFTVFTADTKTEVIGTSFNLRARENEPVKVQVATGKVAFASREDEEAVFLIPGEEAAFQEDVVISKPIEDSNYRAWQNKTLVFSNTDLQALVKKLESYFGTTIIIASEELQNCRFTVSFNDPDIDKVLQVIALTGNLKIEETVNGYNISGEGCKKQ